MSESMTSASASSGTGPATAARVVEGHKSFGPLQVLKGVSFEVPPGSVVCLIGPSGSGKSTLLRCMNLIEELDSGRIYVNDRLMGYRETAGGKLERLDNRSIYAARRQIGFVFQLFHLWPHKTVLGNVTEALRVVKKLGRAEADELGLAMLRKVDLLDKRDDYPSTLSGGQQQRVAIARALAMEPTVLLFDEPTSALDPELIGEVIDVMKRLAAEGNTMVVATHEMGFAREAADQMIFLDGGRIVEAGPPKQFFEAPQQARTRTFLTRMLGERKS